MIQDAQDAHSGVYTCSPSNAIVGKIRVHVLNGMFLTLNNKRTQYFKIKLQNGMYCLK